MSPEDLLPIKGTKYSIFQEAARAAGLSKSEDFVNEVLDDVASVMNLTEKERKERIFLAKNFQERRQQQQKKEQINRTT
ncbi:hypothetical protein TNCV_2119281 [Trichonephila clavipes]|nr:hypothetical protein TNCV_2119281 [Trichonephila clavipes]